MSVAPSSAFVTQYGIGEELEEPKAIQIVYSKTGGQLGNETLMKIKNHDDFRNNQNQMPLVYEYSSTVSKNTFGNQTSESSQMILTNSKSFKAKQRRNNRSLKKDECYGYYSNQDIIKELEAPKIDTKVKITETNSKEKLKETNLNIHNLKISNGIPFKRIHKRKNNMEEGKIILHKSPSNKRAKYQLKMAKMRKMNNGTVLKGSTFQKKKKNSHYNSQKLQDLTHPLPEEKVRVSRKVNKPMLDFKQYFGNNSFIRDTDGKVKRYVNYRFWVLSNQSPCAQDFQFKAHKHQQKINMIVESLQDKDIYLEKLRQFEERQKVIDQIQSIKENIKNIIIKKGNNDEKNIDSDESRGKMTITTLPLFLNNNISHCRSKSVQKLPIGSKYALCKNTILIKGVFGQPKLLKQKDSQRNKSVRRSENPAKGLESERKISHKKISKNQNCVIKIPNQQPVGDANSPETKESVKTNIISKNNTKDSRLQNQLESSFMSVGNKSHCNTISSVESQNIMKAISQNHIYDKKKAKAIDSELQKYVKFQKDFNTSMISISSNVHSNSSRVEDTYRDGKIKKEKSNMKNNKETVHQKKKIIQMKFDSSIITNPLLQKKINYEAIKMSNTPLNVPEDEYQPNYVNTKNKSQDSFSKMKKMVSKKLKREKCFIFKRRSHSQAKKHQYTFQINKLLDLNQGIFSGSSEIDENIENSLLQDRMRMKRPNLKPISDTKTALDEFVKIRMNMK
ncbi:unnamed protein product [Moneuplotes crassus]|uniref:Uncharacterized protein n=2 Tax=Euplotes crassus TaxID=5936 RepID=A0AAD2D7Y9_EUPCR|nr:unnamed protein product [Moneuplotes crassus]